jgi:hypothetical protein
MSAEAINTPVEGSGWVPEDQSHLPVIRWTRQANGTYAKEGSLSADVPTARIYSVDQDYETNLHAVCPGLKLWLKEEAVTLVERKIADESYRGWRYEIRPETPSAEPPPVPAVAPSENSAFHLCLNPRCKKGPNDTHGIVTSRRAKYCCSYCRVDVCRRSRPKPEQIEKPRRKRRRDAKYTSHSERQRAYQRKHSTAHLPQGIKDLLWMRARTPRVRDNRVPETT